MYFVLYRSAAFHTYLYESLITEPIFYLCFIVVLLYVYFGVSCEFQLDSLHHSH